METYKKLIEQIKEPSRFVERGALIVFFVHAIWQIWVIYSITRPGVYDHIQINLPDPQVIHFLRGVGHLFLIALSVLILGRLHVVLCVALVALNPIYLKIFEVADALPFMPQPTPVMVISLLPAIALLVGGLFRKRFRRLDSLAVVACYTIVLGTIMLYHMAFMGPLNVAYKQALKREMAAFSTYEPGELGGYLLRAGAKDVSALNLKDIRELDATVGKSEDTAPASASSIQMMRDQPKSMFTWQLPGRTFSERRVMVYDGRAATDAERPKLFLLPMHFQQEAVLIASGGLYFLCVVLLHFWLFLVLFVTFIHGRHIKRIYPLDLSRRR
jgi:hypothetical protein